MNASISYHFNPECAADDEDSDDDDDEDEGDKEVEEVFCNASSYVSREAAPEGTGRRRSPVQSDADKLHDFYIVISKS